MSGEKMADFMQQRLEGVDEITIAWRPSPTPLYYQHPFRLQHQQAHPYYAVSYTDIVDADGFFIARIRPAIYDNGVLCRLLVELAELRYPEGEEE